MRAQNKHAHKMDSSSILFDSERCKEEKKMKRSSIFNLNLNLNTSWRLVLVLTLSLSLVLFLRFNVKSDENHSRLKSNFNLNLNSSAILNVHPNPSAMPISFSDLDSESELFRSSSEPLLSASASASASFDWRLEFNASTFLILDSNTFSIQQQQPQALAPSFSFKSWYKKLPQWLMHSRRPRQKKSSTAPIPDSRSTSTTKTRSHKRRKSKSMRLISDYQWLHHLGAGGYGTVRLAILKSHPKDQYVIKKVPKRKLTKDRWMVLTSRHPSQGNGKELALPLEASMLLYARWKGGPNMIRLVEYLEDKSDYYLVFEALENAMDLTRWIQNAKRKLALNSVEEAKFGLIRTPNARLWYKARMRELVAAISFLHEHYMIHGDIKDENILLYTPTAARSKSSRLKLIDFGSTAYCPPGLLLNVYRGGSKYKSPEVAASLHGFYDPYAQEIWSLGVLFYYFRLGAWPNGLTPSLLMRTDESKDGQLWSHLVHQMLQPNPKHRPCIQQIQRHAYFQFESES